LITHKIAEKLKENNAASVVFMVDNNKVHPSNKQACFTTYQFVDQRLKELSWYLIPQIIETRWILLLSLV